VTEPTPERPKPVQVFVAHGKNLKPLEQLRKILNEWQVPFVVAVDEANAGRPISEKVADLMKSCSAGIFIFSADEEFTDGSGTKIFRPSQNVIYELGAAGLLYGRKIVVFKESAVTFPSDFSDLGWIQFERDALDAKAMDLLRELIALRAVKLVSSGGE
jgi:predicted nucleotide-binding protein